MNNYNTYELTIAITACTRSVHAQATQSPSMEWRGGQEDSLLAKELLMADGCWERKALSLWSLKGTSNR